MTKASLNCEEKEKQLRAAFPVVTWTSIYFEGTKLYVEVKENEKVTGEHQQSQGMDIMATEDGVISSIITRNGIPQVKAGDTVEKDLIQKFIPSLDLDNADNAKCKEAYDAYTKAHNVTTESDVIAMDKELGGSTESLILKAGDDRAMFYAGYAGGVRRLSPDKQIKNFFDGLSIVKWSNVRTDGGQVAHQDFCDTDIPLFRLAEIYLTRAEASYRLGDEATALSDIQTLQKRANRNNVTKSVDLSYILDEWCREFYLEGRRRSDLVRFGLYTSSKYLWSFKGGQPNGAGVDSHYNVYPIPANDLSGNPNLTQNPGY